MTARQRALASGVTGEVDGVEKLEMLDFGGKPGKAEKEMTEEDKVEKQVKVGRAASSYFGKNHFVSVGWPDQE